MGGKGVSKRMERYALADSGRIGRLMEHAVELAGCHRLTGPLAWKQPALLHGSGIETPPARLPPLAQQVERVRGPLEKCSKPLAAVNMAPLRPRAEFACIHVLDHALAQRADRNRTHGQLLSWMRLMTPPSSRQADMPAIDDLSFGYRALG